MGPLTSITTAGAALLSHTNTDHIACNLGAHGAVAFLEAVFAEGSGYDLIVVQPGLAEGYVIASAFAMVMMLMHVTEFMIFCICDGITSNVHDFKNNFMQGPFL